MKDARLQGEITNSSNIVGKQSSAQLEFEDHACLLNRAISTGCVIRGPQVVLIRTSANILGVRSLSADGLSHLMREPIHSGRMTMTKVDVEGVNPANAKVAGTIRMRNSFAVPSMMTVENVSRTSMSVRVRNLANSYTNWPCRSSYYKSTLL